MSETPLENEPTPTLASLPEPLGKALRERGFDHLTAVQKAILKVGAKGQDLQVSSQTGSGKTVALGILMAERLGLEPREGAEPGTRALVIAPTRELANQVQDELTWLFAGLPHLTVEVVTGGTQVWQERKRLQARPVMLVGTPGRLLDHIRSGALDVSQVSELILDEADQMLDMGFREDLEAILDSTPTERDTHMVSATFPPGIKKLAERYQRAPRHIEGTRLGVANADIEHVAYLVRQENRYPALVNLLLLTERRRTLVFVNTRADATVLAQQLGEDGFTAMALSGELQQSQRTQTLAAFRSGSVPILVATDVAARGLDVPNVDTVIHAGPPMDSDTYTHRSGRTGRAGRKGHCILLVPGHRERKFRRLLREARIDSSWEQVPNEAAVQKTLIKNQRRRLFEAIDQADGPPPTDLEFARKLVEARDPVQVVATLLGRNSSSDLPCEPKSLDAPSSPTGPAKFERERPSSSARHPNAGKRYPNAGPRPVNRPGHVSFWTNWGVRGGADPRRLLAMICRRGGITSRDVGVIRVENFHSTFEISAMAADAFEGRARARDPRDPKIRIERDQGLKRNSPRRGFEKR